jgi:hypothetical protein
LFVKKCFSAINTLGGVLVEIVQFPFDRDLIKRLKPVAEANNQTALDFITRLVENAIETHEQEGWLNTQDS